MPGLQPLHQPLLAPEEERQPLAAAHVVPAAEDAKDEVQGAIIRVEDAGGADAGLSTFWACVFNLSKVIMGAGMMAVPKAFFLVGFPAGMGVIIAIAGLTAFTLAGLVTASEVTGARTYSALTIRTLGTRAEKALHFAVFVNCWVMNVVFIVVLGDILLGTPGECEGLVCKLTGVDSGPLADRKVVLGAVAGLVLAPLTCLRDMRRLAPINVAGNAANALFGATSVALAAAATARGVAEPLPLSPRWEELGGGSTAPLPVAMGIASILPILLNCSVCHQSLHPLMPLLRPYTHARMRAVVGAAIGACNTLYVLIALGCCLAFGERLRSDALGNVTAAAMAPILGPSLGGALALSVRAGYLLSLVGSFVLLGFPQRGVLAETLLPSRALEGSAGWLGVSLALVASQYATAVFVPSIWGLLELVGATASTVQAFIVPGAIILMLEERSGHRVLAALAVACGVVLFTNGVAQPLVRWRAAPGAPAGPAGEPLQWRPYPAVPVAFL